MQMKLTPAEEPVRTVSELCALVQKTLSANPDLRGVRVVGEIFRVSPSHGHYYFELKDSAARISCALFSNRAGAAACLPQEGKTMVVTGYIDFYAPYGKLTCIVETVQDQGEGALYARFLRLKEMLEKEGLFDLGRKKKPTHYPKKIAVVTSPEGAALQDIINQLIARNPFVELVVVPAKVQGMYAKDDIVSALKKAEGIPGVDTIILARGGGSIEELWPFNEEEVARTIAACKIPVICGVGHEIDHTIAEYVADVAATTPTQAAVLVTRNMSEELDRLKLLHARSRSVAAMYLHRRRSELAALMARMETVHPRVVLDRHRQGAAFGAERLDAAYRRHIDRQRHLVQRLEGKLVTLDPLAVIERGYCIVMKDGQALRTTKDVHEGDIVSIRVKNGSLTAKIIEKEEYHEQ